MSNDKRSATPARRAARNFATVLLVGLAIGGGIVFGRSELMQRATYRLRSQTDTPVSIATATPPSVAITTVPVAPLFESYGVQLVLAGHDHDYQRSEEINGVTYVVSGGAALLRPAHRADFSVAAWSVVHFTDITVWGDRLELRAVDQQLDVFDMVTLRP